MSKRIKVSGGLRTKADEVEASLNRACFDENPASWETKIENFPKYVKRQNLTRFLALYEIFKRILEVKGSIIECGVNHGFGVMSWCKFSSILEPVNLTRRIYGFDTFEGFPSLTDKDRSSKSDHVKMGDLAADTKTEIERLAGIYDSTRFLGHVPKLTLIKGDATDTIPRFIKEHPHLLISLLFMDFDLYEPTRVALKHFLPLMPRGAVVAFDELDNPLWPGETQAMLEFLEEHRFRLERCSFDPYIGYAVLD